MAQSIPLRGVLLFHLNLSYSAIPVADRGQVVRRCYHPLLDLLDAVPDAKIAIEASGHTLERIAELDPAWVERLRDAVRAGRVEFVGSGDSQLIGPLVPETVNHWNQRLGRETYREILGVEPAVALVNEMAWSQGIVSSYVDAGYRAVVMEWNNPRRTHPEWEEEWRYRRVRTAAPGGEALEVLWADAVAFQKLQRAVAGDLEFEEYVDWVVERAGDSEGKP
ncbi:MAG TPA: glycoside hydrolase family 57, partial [Planctomycetes bacterium]|nr:glycoside hydrolase family 57 [Planctomycetota bacterium]